MWFLPAELEGVAVSIANNRAGKQRVESVDVIIYLAVFQKVAMLKINMV